MDSLHIPGLYDLLTLQSTLSPSVASLLFLYDILGILLPQAFAPAVLGLLSHGCPAAGSCSPFSSHPPSPNVSSLANTAVPQMLPSYSPLRIHTAQHTTHASRLSTPSDGALSRPPDTQHSAWPAGRASARTR